MYARAYLHYSIYKVTEDTGHFTAMESEMSWDSYKAQTCLLSEWIVFSAPWLE